MRKILMHTQISYQSDIAYYHKFMEGWFGFYGGTPLRLIYKKIVPHMKAFLANENGWFLAKQEWSVNQKHSELINYMYLKFGFGLFVKISNIEDRPMYVTRIDENDNVRVKVLRQSRGYIAPLEILKIDFEADPSLLLKGIK